MTAPLRSTTAFMRRTARSLGSSREISTGLTTWKTFMPRPSPIPYAVSRLPGVVAKPAPLPTGTLNPPNLERCWQPSI